ncbi:hypothetical protein B0H63DRAFT_453718 [Podospora didyma]|uniref:BPL/LPL catalytic domain-containing protein n=1 Tax=Podospora didyma TaxID=330526 RepID=A0AAE0KA82_9PEZI|nr:hypothetical protein B0H63DRAFT_453718 [Podospora didyma]
MRLRHIHLPFCSAQALYPPYSLASRVQEHLRRQLLDFKDKAATSDTAAAATTAAAASHSHSGSSHDGGLPPPPPPPTLLSFTPLPAFTLGRRQTAPLSESEMARLQEPLHVTTSSSSTNTTNITPLPVSIVNSPRGGLTTYHGPGQTVLWPVLDLRSPHHKQFTVRCYSRLLEDTTIATLRSMFGLAAFTTADPGVWVRRPHLLLSGQHVREDGEPGAAAAEAKIAALGVHLRRHVSALGTAINVAMPSADVVDEQRNPWARIVACGLEGKVVTSVAGELNAASRASNRQQQQQQEHQITDDGGAVNNATPPPSLENGGHVAAERAVAASWAEELARRIGVEGVDVVPEKEVVSLLADLVREAAAVDGDGGGDGSGATAEEQDFVARMTEQLLVSSSS